MTIYRNLTAHGTHLIVIYSQCNMTEFIFAFYIIIFDFGQQIL